MASADPFPVVVHRIPSKTPNLVAYERSISQTNNALVFIGGLTEGPHCRPAVNVIAQKLKDTEAERFGVWELHMRSSYTGFGYSSLSNDVEDISALVAYLRTLGKDKIVLCGSSTGCQDCLEYADREKHKSTPVDGYILLNPVSDRETASLLVSPENLEETIRYAQQMIGEGKGKDAMPVSLIPPSTCKVLVGFRPRENVFQSPITAYRWHSLVAKGGDDDYFSADLDDASISVKFGRIDKPILFLPGENDELVPPTVDRKDMLRRWIQACPAGVVSKLTSFVPDCDHSISDPEAQIYVSEYILQFVEDLIG